MSVYVRIKEGLENEANQSLLLSIHATCQKLNLPFYTTATASYLFWRYVAHNEITSSFGQVRLVSACILLSCKIEETLRKVRDILNVACSVMRTTETDFDDAKKQVIDYEQRLLEAIGFNFHLVQPQKYVVKMCRKYRISKNQALIAWNLAENSFRTPVCIQYPPTTIAFACILLSAYFIEDPTNLGRMHVRDHRISFQAIGEAACIIMEYLQKHQAKWSQDEFPRIRNAVRDWADEHRNGHGTVPQFQQRRDENPRNWNRREYDRRYSDHSDRSEKRRRYTDNDINYY